MNLNKLIFTENPCYKTGRKITVKGIMVHSTGANNPWLKRYVGPDDGKLGKNQYNNHWNQEMDRSVCVHGFIGKLADGSIATYQTLPWDHRGWHAASGKNGSANNTHIGFEICEDGLTDSAYFNKVYQEAVELCVYLCKEFGLTEKNIICHSEGHAQGIASNHGDVMHWFPKHGKSMDTFRADVKALLEKGSGGVSADTSVSTPVAANTSENERIIWDFLSGKGLNDYAVAGIMGNLYAESALRPNNLQNTYEKKLDMTDEAYTKAVDDGSYDNFVKDSAGYGLVQWTYWSRKQALLEFAKAAGVSIGDLQMQLDFLWKEIQNYGSVMAMLKDAASVREVSDIVLFKYEAPADQSEAVQEKRAGYGQSYYNKYAKPVTAEWYRVRKSWADASSQKGAFRELKYAKSCADQNPGYSVFDNDGNAIYPVAENAGDAGDNGKTEAFTPYRVRVSIDDLNIRKAPGTDKAKTGKYTGKGVFTIVDETDGKGATKWGLLKSYADKRNGWVSLDYCQKL